MHAVNQKMAEQVVGGDELLDLTNTKGYAEDASEGKKIIMEEGELFYRQTATKHKVCKSVETSWYIYHAERLLSLLLTALHSVYSTTE